ncbi:VIT1/CCC1 transporter family protein [Raineyella fluvialis]|uniref:VIT family protein n=1 Tax=Raineyella fluvialis TaxID=2662261 RepID=A0A5Q2FCT6_9ACTN|nr:VIT family protein [Raineyella fluvialis]QGF22903.1 VIT family protein [Raineyella fluvialis]
MIDSTPQPPPRDEGDSGVDEATRADEAARIGPEAEARAVEESDAVVQSATAAHPSGAPEPHTSEVAGKLNWLRAGVLGANDGIVSIAGLIIGVAAVNPGATSAILVAGVAGLISGAVSMALGEYVSVSTQRDTEKALIEKETYELENYPDQEFAELVGLYRHQGLSKETATRVAHELTAHDALGSHLHIELGIDEDQLTNPWQAAMASAIAFTAGAVLPILAMLVTPLPMERIPVTFGVVLLALALTGVLSARLGGARKGPAVVRLLVGGGLGMAITYGIGTLLGVSAP